PSAPILLIMMSLNEKTWLHSIVGQIVFYISICSKRYTIIMPHVRHALHYYNARPIQLGDEFDAAKPLMESRASFRKRQWAHVNFWARSLKSNKIKRFFADVHYKPRTYQEPLGRYRKSCAFCPGNRDILHPVGSRKFVCGNDKDRMLQQFKPHPFSEFRGMPFTGCPSSASPAIQQEDFFFEKEETSSRHLHQSMHAAILLKIQSNHIVRDKSES
ncbi:hypothetical protein ZWY2020_029981, partial [Hordeum vulgare]